MQNICNNKFLPPILIVISFFIYYVIVFTNLVIDVCYSVFF
jgi:hypothetical protein